MEVLLTLFVTLVILTTLGSIGIYLAKKSKVAQFEEVETGLTLEAVEDLWHVKRRKAEELNDRKMAREEESELRAKRALKSQQKAREQQDRLEEQLRNLRRK